MAFLYTVNFSAQLKRKIKTVSNVKATQKPTNWIIALIF